MFSTTFLGHQGWLFSTSTTRLIVDPLLTPSFGHGGAIGQIYPPRLIRFDEFPPIDAVLLTHEHEDHFDIPSLNRLDRRIPILLSTGSSCAAGQILTEMGFEVRRCAAGEQIGLGDLEVHLFAP